MKIGILTWSKAVNHGAVLQTYATFQLLKKMGHSPIVLDYAENDSNMDNTFWKRFRRAFSRVRPDKLIVRMKLPKWIEIKQQNFEAFRTSHLCVGKLYSDEPNLDKVLIGSDMVFDFYEGYNPFMYGEGVNCDSIFSYAACFGYTTRSLLEKYIHKDRIVSLIRKLNGVSYRDNNTGDILREVCGITNATKTIDPVMLYGFNEERKQWNTNNWRDKKYILVYSYTYNMDRPDEIKAIREYAQKRGLEIISAGYLHLWCDRSVNASPSEFVEMVENAELIVTDTFHGTIFSLTFGKQFVVAVRNNAFKIEDILNDLKLGEYLNGTLEQKLKRISKQPIDYEIVNARINELRGQSMKYLAEQVNAKG